ncbi:hypothetical protein [Streptomyces sp. YS415]|uniref:hypothetical protein n=1 Tax=Streptomyces sp. YS415 TaxID=2944806 RepID=UPI00202272FD|nr:hypothetical protein [Streptomyces sp. YS415]MCL7429433.1 hypothetical protein [Streptomyces sp. YS415]
MTAEHDGVDALMAALTDEPLPEEADAAYLAEHRAATADITALREQLDIIGRALGGETPKPAPAPVPLRPVRRRAFRLAAGTLAAAAAATVMVGLGWLVVQADPGASSADSGASAAKEAQQDTSEGVLFGSPRYLACAYLVAEGEVRSAEPAAAGGPELIRVTVELTRVHKPGKPGPERGDDLAYVIDENTAPGLRAGDHVLFGVPEKGAPPDMWVVGETEVARERDRIDDALPESRSLDCG